MSKQFLRNVSSDSGTVPGNPYESVLDEAASVNHDLFPKIDMLSDLHNNPLLLSFLGFCGEGHVPMMPDSSVDIVQPVGPFSDTGLQNALPINSGFPPQSQSMGNYNMDLNAHQQHGYQSVSNEQQNLNMPYSSQHLPDRLGTADTKLDAFLDSLQPNTAGQVNSAMMQRHHPVNAQETQSLEFTRLVQELESASNDAFKFNQFSPNKPHAFQQLPASSTCLHSMSTVPKSASSLPDARIPGQEKVKSHPVITRILLDGDDEVNLPPTPLKEKPFIHLPPLDKPPLSNSESSETSLDSFPQEEENSNWKATSTSTKKKKVPTATLR